MAYPSSIDAFTSPAGTSLLASGPDHAVLHTSVNTAIGSIETVVGTNSGTNVLKNFTAGKLAARTVGETHGTSTWIGGTIGTVTVGTSLIQGGTVNNAVVGSPSVTGGTTTGALNNSGTFGTPSLTLGGDTTGDLFYRSAGGTVTRIPVGSNTQVLTTNGTTPSWGNNAVTDGWTSESHTWVYASASSFTISGIDLTTTFTKGTRIKFTQSAVVQYAVVSSSSFSSNTTVNIVVNTDYTVANSAISAPSYSYQVNPQGWPGWFNFTTTWGGFSVNPTGTWKYTIVGNMCTVKFSNSANGTSSAVTTTFTLPIAPLTTQEVGCIGLVMDNSTVSTSPGHGVFSAASTTVNAYKNYDQIVWTNSGSKHFNLITVTYEF